DAASMFEFHMAADARMSRTKYVDDQAWKLDLGGTNRAALAFQTQFGGRAGLVSIVPMWLTDGHPVYQYQSYHHPPVLTHFAPNFLAIRAEIAPWLELKARYWVMESNAAGCEFSIKNHNNEDLELQIELFAHVVINGRNKRLNVLTMGDYSLALHLGQIGNINPVLTLEGAGMDIYGGRISSPKLGRRLVLPAGETRTVPFAVAGLPDMRDSHSVTMNWLSRPWEIYFKKIDDFAAAIPRIQTGDKSWDRLLDLSYNLLLQAQMGSSDQLSHASLVANRATNRGWSRRGDGRDHIRPWAGQDPTLAYLAATSAANIAPDWAKGLIHNYLSTQDDTGFVDRQPGLAGQTQGLMMMPLLARMSWTVFQLTEDRGFLAEVFPRLTAFFGRWLQEDQDADGVPEWQSERQMGYVAFPTFGMGQGWAQGANVRQMETPDLLAYLISEADALCSIAWELDDQEVENEQRQRLSDLQDRLEEFWNGSRYSYRDRDSHLTNDSIELLRRGPGDEIHIIERPLPAPDRVMIRVVGGVNQVPRIRLRLTGLDSDGEDCLIEADVDAFDWQNRQGVYTTRQALSFVGTIEIEGLSRVYKVYASTIDSARLDINHLLPLWTGLLAKDRASALVRQAMDESQFYCPNGITMVSRSDPNFDPSNARGGGGIWMYFLSLVGEGMVKSGFHQEATDLVKRVLSSLCQVLDRDGHLSQFYHAEEIKGFGEDHHIGGIVPLKLFSDVIGIRILSPLKVWVGGPFTWEQELKVEQHGVVVARNADGIHIDFPSGYSQSLAAEAEWQAVADPTPIETADEAAALPAPPELDTFADGDDEARIQIDIDAGDQGDAARTPDAPPDANAGATDADNEEPAAP
ncbi:MAG: hypothetical protein OXE52_12445, partial [Chloroflexi bacterium]|nr:hypothetical protein [Chloroflexota bacterium]